MLIDVVFAVIIVMAVVKGYRRGLVVGVFTALALMIALAAATKLSAVVAGYLSDNLHAAGRWLPFVSFILVFAGMVLMVQWTALMIKKTAGLLLMGWLDTLGGIVLYALIYTTIFSVVLFFAVRLQLIEPASASQSAVYAYVSPLGPWAIDGIGYIVPVFRGLFEQLERFFEGVAGNIRY